MEELLRHFPEHLLEGYESAKRQLPKSRIKREAGEILFCGMGGSAVGARLLTNLIERPTVGIRLHASYGLPASPDKPSLAVIVSYSGETEETLSGYREAGAKHVQRLAVASGGKLTDWAKRDHVPVIRVPGGLPPRMALPCLLTAVLAVIGRASGRDFEKELKSAAAGLKRGEMRIRHEAENMAEHIAAQSGIPLIWGVSGLTDAVAYRWRTQINENAKMLAFSHNFPELCHNEIVPVALTDIPLTVLTLEAPGTPARMARRQVATLGVILESNPNVAHIPVRAKSANRFAAVLELVWLGDWVSYYLAKLNGVDPAAIPPIVELKKRMGTPR